MKKEEVEKISWEKEFDKEFCGALRVFSDDDRLDRFVTAEVKDFIRKLLSHLTIDEEEVRKVLVDLCIPLLITDPENRKKIDICGLIIRELKKGNIIKVGK